MTPAVVRTITSNLDELARGDRTDGQLLDLFVRKRDHAAFESLVRRHGPMVLGVCRRVLRNPADADDALQAAFLVLARKAGTLGARELLARWLYGVAFNTARKLRRTNSRRFTREQPVAEVPEPPGAERDERRDELLAALDEELSRLPDRYRTPIVLCDLEGATRKEAAARLGWPEGTVAGRLARARALLAQRLAGRRVAPAGAVAAVLAARVAVSAGMVGAVMGAVSDGVVSSRVAGLTTGVVSAMFVRQVRNVAAVVLLAGLALAGAAGLLQPSATAQPLKPLGDPFAPPDKPAPAKKVLTVQPLKKLDGKATAEKCSRLLSNAVTVAAVRDENALLIYATEADTADVLKLLRGFGEEIAERPQSPAPADAKREPEVKRSTVRFENAAWADVLEWYAKESGLTPVIAVKPVGTVTIRTPKDRQYTLAEVTDLINEMLMQQKFILIRKQLTFTLHPADEKIDPTMIPRIELSELPSRGKTEIVQVLITLGDFLDAAETAPDVQKMLTPFGAVAALLKTNTLILQDTAGNINRIVQTLKEVENQPGGRARKRFAELLDSYDPLRKRDGVGGVDPLMFRPEPDKKAGEKDTLTYRCDRIRAADAAKALQGFVPAPSDPKRATAVLFDEVTNTVYVVGPPDSITIAKGLFEALEKRAAGNAPPRAEAELKRYSVPPGAAAEIARALQSDKAELRVVALSASNELLVLASPAEHVLIAQKLRDLSADGAKKKEPEKKPDEK